PPRRQLVHPIAAAGLPLEIFFALPIHPDKFAQAHLECGGLPPLSPAEACFGAARAFHLSEPSFALAAPAAEI
ncbi:MAG: hypothetical protein WBD66_03510, partial [Candidatus Acidiferrales bacterium]